MTESTEEILETFSAAATAYGAAIAVGNSKAANTNLERATTLYRELRDRGPTAQTRLLDLLAQDDLAVRYLVAVHALDFAPVEGERALGEILRGSPSPLQLLARVSLSQWRSGVLRF